MSDHNCGYAITVHRAWQHSAVPQSPIRIAGGPAASAASRTAYALMLTVVNMAYISSTVNSKQYSALQGMPLYSNNPLPVTMWLQCCTGSLYLVAASHDSEMDNALHGSLCSSVLNSSASRQALGMPCAQHEDSPMCASVPRDRARIPQSSPHPANNQLTISSATQLVMHTALHCYNRQQCMSTVYTQN